MLPPLAGSAPESAPRALGAHLKLPGGIPEPVQPLQPLVHARPADLVGSGQFLPQRMAVQTLFLNEVEKLQLGGGKTGGHALIIQEKPGIVLKKL